MDLIANSESKLSNLIHYQQFGGKPILNLDFEMNEPSFTFFPED